MKTLGTSGSYPYSSSYHQNLWESFACGLEDNSKHEKKITKTHAKLMQRENGRCEICHEIEKKKMKGSSQLQNGKEEEVVVIIDDNEEKMNGPLERKVVGNGDIEGEKMDVKEENIVLWMEKGKANEEKRKELEEIMVESGEVGEGKIVIIDDCVDMGALLGNSDAGEGGEENINGEGDRFPGWNQWKFEVEQKWYRSYPFWENENSALNFWDIEVEPPANDWVVSLWQL